VKRPIGVPVLAIFVLASSFLTLFGASTAPHVRAGSRLLLAALLLLILALLAAEALWRLRPHAFLMFTAWAICAMAGLVLSRLAQASSGHGIRLFGPILYAGLAYAVAALYLRRVV
jgi:hypothetical protein